MYKRKDSIEKLQSHLLNRHQEDSLSFVSELLSLESRKKEIEIVKKKTVGQKRDKRQKNLRQKIKISKIICIFSSATSYLKKIYLTLFFREDSP